ncbi:hypothetical protein BC940DRAFT_347663 [Gongronella butleri]|nr:hypothetical protein BC940DRAFT_347663 [Gongronella butleri]
MPSRFAHQFWEDATTNGVAVLVNRMRQAKKTCEHLLGIYEARAALEEHHAAQLLSMASTLQQCEEVGQLGVTLDTMEDQWAILAEEHLHLAKKIKANALNPLMTLLIKQKHLRKELQTSTKQLYNRRQLQVNCVLKARDRYNAECTKANEIMQQTTGKREKQLTYRRANTAIQKYQQAYDEAMAHLERLTDEWNDRWQYTCQEFETLEQERVAFLRDNITGFHDMVLQHLNTSTAAYNMMHDQALRIDADHDLDVMVKEFGGNSTMPTAVDYIKLQLLYEKAKQQDQEQQKQKESQEEHIKAEMEDDEPEESHPPPTSVEEDHDDHAEQEENKSSDAYGGLMVGRMEICYNSDYYTDYDDDDEDNDDDAQVNDEQLELSTPLESDHTPDADLVSSIITSPDDAAVPMQISTVPAPQWQDKTQQDDDEHVARHQPSNGSLQHQWRVAEARRLNGHDEKTINPATEDNDRSQGTSSTSSSSHQSPKNFPPPLPRHATEEKKKNTGFDNPECEDGLPSDNKMTVHEDLEDMLQQLERQPSVPSLPRKKIRPSTRMRISGVRQRRPIERTAQDLLQDLTNSKSILDSVASPTTSATKVSSKPLAYDDPFGTVNSLASNAFALASPHATSTGASTASRPSLYRPYAHLQSQKAQQNPQNSSSPTASSPPRQSLRDYLDNAERRRSSSAMQPIVRHRPLPPEPAMPANRIPWKGEHDFYAKLQKTDPFFF